MRIHKNRIITAADDENMMHDDLDAEFEDSLLEDDDTLDDTLDTIADNIEDIQDQVDDIQEDDVDIEIDNNIDGHYIAECDRCQGIFISAVIESDQEVEKITGICPLCEKESDQYLIWKIQSVNK